jgi:glycosyltransferase involved in cell wall biosynthesis
MKPTSASRPTILHCVTTRWGLGGTLRYAQLIMSSSLAQKYDFELIDAGWALGGLKPWAVLRAWRILRNKRPSLLHLHALGVGAFHVSLAARLARQKTLLTVHGYTEDDSFRKWWQRTIITRLCEPWTLRLANAAYCVSRYATTKPIYRRHVSRDLGYIDNAVPVCDVPPRDDTLRQQFGFGPDDIVAMCASRMTRDKGIQDLIQAFHSIARRAQRQPRLLLVGDGSDMEAFRTAAQPLLQSGQVVMPGRRSDVFQLLGIADFFVLPSLHENQSLAILEGMMAAKAVVATRTGGTPELVVHDCTGLLCPPAAPDALASALLTLTRDASLRYRLGSAGRARALERFTMDRFTPRLAEVYEHTLAMAT